MSIKKFTAVLLSIFFFMEAMKQCFKHYQKTCHQEGMWYGYIKSSVFLSVRKTNNKYCNVSHCCTSTVDTRSSSFVLIKNLMKGKDPRLQNCHHIECKFCKSRGKIMRVITLKILLSEITFLISLLHPKKNGKHKFGKMPCPFEHF